MRIRCNHGFFKFDESRPGELSRFISHFGLELESYDGYTTFKQLTGAPEYSLEGKPYLGATAIATYAGKPWDIFEANGFVYNYDRGLVVPIESVTTRITLEEAGNYFVTPGMILPGSTTDGGKRVTDYAAFFSFDSLRFKYSEVGYVED